MSDDRLRKSLVTQFVCAKCGDFLSLSYDKPPSPKNTQLADCSITGACKVDGIIAIHPCDKCYGALIKPINALRDAMKAITGDEK